MKRIPWTGALFLLFATVAHGESQSWSQHVELLREGTITDAAGQTWDVSFILGTRRVNDVFVLGWEGAGESMLELVGSELWIEDIPEEIVDGVDFSRDVVMEHFAEGVVDDVELARQRNAELRPGDFGRGFLIPWNWAKATAMMTLRTVWLPVGTTLGVVYSAAAPPVMVAWRPVVASLQIVFLGVFTPTLGHTWNGTTWAATFFNAVPERETRWVRRTTRRIPFEFDRDRLAQFARGTAAERVLATREAEQADALREIDAAIGALREERGELIRERGEGIQQALDATAAKQRIRDEAERGGRSRRCRRRRGFPPLSRSGGRARTPSPASRSATRAS
jgi:hypothetical protein